MKSTQRQSRMIRQLQSALLCLVFLSVWVPGNSAMVVNANTDANDPSAVYGEGASYRIMRKGKRIGTHTVEFERDGTELLVRVESRIKVRVLNVPVFSLRYQATEQWQNGQLRTVQVEVVENGKRSSNQLRQSQTGATILRDNVQVNAEVVGYATNHWHPGVVDTQRVYNTLTGKINSVTMLKVGPASVDVAGQTISATHYKYSGELNTDIWFDDHGAWVKLAFNGGDGSRVTYEKI